MGDFKFGFKNINIKEEYRVPKDNIVNDFFIPVLKNSREYNRSVGYFSSDALIQLSYGICEMVKQGGKINLIVSPNLSNEDYEAINNGYIEREKVVADKMIKQIRDYSDYYQKERFNLVTSLIADGILEVKIAFSLKEGKLGLYHEKLGIMYDDYDDIIAFSGSMNETNNGLSYNYETIDVFKSWEDESRVRNKVKAFEKLWNNDDRSAKVYDFPEIVKNELLKYNYKKANFDIDYEEQKKLVEEYEKKLKEMPRIPDYIQLREYQNEAISSWREHNYRGIFDMATGTGKTITAISAIIDLLEHKEMNCGIIICVPYQHLVTQWNDDLVKFNFNPILGFSTSPQRNWKKRLKREVSEYSYKIRKSFCFVVTNSSFNTEYVQKILKKCKRRMLLVVDEAHNFGAKSFWKLQDDKYTYRLALSATFERHNDEEGTDKLYSFFGTKCIEYTLEQAIEQGMLTKYYYYPIPVNLDQDELEEYNKLSREIGKLLKFDSEGNVKLSEHAKRLLIKRSRIIAGARNKLNKLEEVIEPFKKDNFMLIYCGATRYHSLGSNKEFANEDADNENRQIDAVQKMLYKKMNMKVCQYTSNESAEERELIKNIFEEGNTIQAIVAIKCLDEGVNIPNIKTAFILASSTNEKEYIQRRGRVLRLAKGKDFARIYDFVTLPRNIDEVQATDDIDYDESLVKRELTRVREFSRLSMNERDSDRLIESLSKVYGDIVYKNSEGEL